MRPIKTLAKHTVHNTFFFIMTDSVMLSLLDSANTGAEILQILDTLTDDNQQAVAYAEPTADTIEF